MNSKSVKEGGKHNMYSKSKRFIASFLAVLMAVTMLPVNAVSVAYAEELSVPQIEKSVDADEPVATVEKNEDAGEAEAPSYAQWENAVVKLEATNDSGFTLSEVDGKYTVGYTGVDIKDKIKVTVEVSESETSDYTSSWSETEIKNAGTYTLTVTSTADTDNTAEATLTVTPVALTDVSVSLSDAEVEVGSPAPTPTVTATINEVANTSLDAADYDITYTVDGTPVNDVTTVEAGKTVTVIVTCKGNYTGSATATYTVKSTTPVNEPVQLSACTITIGGKAAVLAEGEYTVEFATEYDNAAIDLPGVAVKKGEDTYSAETDYEYVFKKVVADGDDTVIDNTTGKIQSEGDYTVTISAKTGTDSKLTGDAITVKFTVKKKTTSDEYTVTGTLNLYSENSISKGTQGEEVQLKDANLDTSIFTLIRHANTQTASKSATLTNPKDSSDTLAVTNGLSMGGTGKVDAASIKIVTNGASRITVLYHTNSAGRYIRVMNAAGTEVAKDNATEAEARWITFELAKKGTYYLGSANSGIYIYKIVVEEKEEAPVVTKKLSDATVKLSMTGWTDESTTWKAPYTEEAIVPNVKVIIDGTEVSADDIKNELDITYARKVGETEPTAEDYKKVDDTTLDLINLGTINVKVAAKTDSEIYEGETTPVTYEIKKAAAPTVTTKAIAADVSKATSEQVSAGSMPQEINLAEMFKFDSKYGTATFKNAQVNDASGAENNVLALDPGLAIDGTTLKFNTKATLPNETVKKATITVDAEFKNYETATLTIEVTLSSKTEVTIEGITVAEKTYDGDAVVPTGTLVIKNGETEVTDNDLKQSLVYTYTDKDGNESNEAPKNAGEYTLTVSVPLENESYSGSSAQITVKINQAALTVTAKTREWTIGYAAPAASAPAGKEADWYEVTGLVNNETLEDLEASVGFTYKKGESAVTDWTTLTEEDEIVIVPALEGLANYTVTPVNAKLTVKKEAALKANEHELNLTKDWTLDATSKTFKHNGDNADNDGYFKVEGPAKMADANNSYPLVAYGIYENAIKMNGDGKITFTAPKDSTLEIIVHTQEATSGLKVDSTSLISGSTGKSNATVVKLGDGTLVEPYNHTGAPTDLSVYKVTANLSAGGEHTITRDGKECQLYYVKVTEPSSQSDTVAITPTITAEELAKLDGATLYFTATGETDVPVTASGTAVQLKKGVTYSLVAKKDGTVVQTITAKIDGNASYEVPNAAADITITVEVESLTASITPTISTEEAAKLDGAKVYFTAAGEADKEVVSGTALQLKKGTTYTLVVKKNNVTDETMAAKINDSTEYEVTADATVAITIVTGLTPAERVAITPTISDDDLAKLDGAKVYFTAPGEKLEVTSGTAVNLKKEVKYTLVVEKDGTIVANTTAQIGASSEYTPTAATTVTITISVAQAPTKPAAPTANPASGSSISVGRTITLLPAGAVIYYNMGTSETSVANPTESTGTRYTAPIQATEAGTLVIKAIIVENGLESDVETFTYTVRDNSGKTGFYVELVDDGAYTYTGSAIIPDIKVYNNDELLTEGVDYTVKCANNVNASTKKPATLTVTGKGRFSGSQKVEFNIAQKSLGDAENDIIGTGIETGNIVIAKGSKAVPVIIYNGVKLANKDIVIPNTRYNTVTAEDTPEAEKTVIITAKENGNFTGSLKLDVKVVEKNELKNYQLKVALTRGVTYTYNGSQQEVSLDVKDVNGNLLPETNHLASEYYYVSYNTTDRTNAGVVKFTVYGTGDYAGSVSKSFTIKPADKNKTTVDITGEPWSGSYEVPYTSAGATLDTYFDDEIDVKATITVDDATEVRTLKKDRDYKVTYSGNKKSGTAKATVSFIGNYKGIAKQQKTFTIKGREVNATVGSADLEAINLDVKFGATKPYKKEGIYKAPVILSMDGVTVKNSEFDIKYYTEAAGDDGNFDSSKEMKGKNKLVISSEGETPADSATVYVELTGKAKGNFAGSKITGQYQVYKESTHDLSKAKVTFYSYDAKKARYVAGSKMPYTGEAIVFGNAADDTDHTPYLEVKKGKDTVPADAYKVEYVNNTLKGKATVIIVPNTDGDERTAAGSKTVNFTISALNLKTYKDVLADLFKIGEN